MSFRKALFLSARQMLYRMRACFFSSSLAFRTAIRGISFSTWGEIAFYIESAFWRGYKPFYGSVSKSRISGGNAPKEKDKRRKNRNDHRTSSFMLNLQSLAIADFFLFGSTDTSSATF